MWKRFIEWLFPPRCMHMWDEEERYGIINRRTGKQIGVSSFCKCTKCGERRSFKMFGAF